MPLRWHPHRIQMARRRRSRPALLRWLGGVGRLMAVAAGRLRVGECGRVLGRPAPDDGGCVRIGLAMTGLGRAGLVVWTAPRRLPVLRVELGIGAAGGARPACDAAPARAGMLPGPGCWGLASRWGGASCRHGRRGRRA
ncbi:hypothetical protein GII30_22885 [Gordonia amarae]|uniref:Uncharacterized protein n=1 Tax=Gordonia amarae TaxID=36821 RepID=A0A857MIY6_9ACTN|nr:hypothetical protein GII30_22885 [Gordonia amarae]